MRIGDLDARIEIQVNTPTKSGAGDMIASWSELATVWAQVIPLTGSEKENDQQELAQDMTNFKVRSRSDITPLHRILYDGDVYDIEYVSPVRRGVATMIRAKRNVA